MRLTDDLSADLVREWITQYGQLLRAAPKLAAQLTTGRDDFEMVPVPRALFNSLAVPRQPDLTR